MVTRCGWSRCGGSWLRRSRLFHRIDRGAAPREVPPHQTLVHGLLQALQPETEVLLLSAVLGDHRWSQIRSSAPAYSWRADLERLGMVSPDPGETKF